MVTPETMKAWAVDTPGPVDSHPLRRVDRSIPIPGPGQVRVHVRVCGVCRTDLHLAEGDLPPKKPLVIPGHEVVGIVDGHGAGCTRFALGDRVGVPWLGHTCGICRFCLAGQENLCLRPRFTGWDVDGGYAEYVVVEEGFAYPIPDNFSDEDAAPLLCAGIIGYRALRRSQLPPAGRLGIYGFGGSAHLATQIAIAEGARVHVMTRAPGSPRARPRTGGGQRPRCRRPAPRTPRRRHPVRPGRRPGPPGAGGPRSGWVAGHRRDLPDGHPTPQLREASSFRSGRCAVSRPIPVTTGTSSSTSPPASRCGSPRPPTGSTRRMPRWPIWLTAGSTAPRCFSTPPAGDSPTPPLAGMGHAVLILTR